MNTRVLAIPSTPARCSNRVAYAHPGRILKKQPRDRKSNALREEICPQSGCQTRSTRETTHQTAPATSEKPHGQCDQSRASKGSGIGMPKSMKTTASKGEVTARTIAQSLRRARLCSETLPAKCIVVSVVSGAQAIACYQRLAQF